MEIRDACSALVLSNRHSDSTKRVVASFLETTEQSKPSQLRHTSQLSVQLIDCMLNACAPIDGPSVGPDEFIEHYLRNGSHIVYEQDSAGALDVFAVAVEMLLRASYPRVHLFLWPGHALLLCNVGKRVAIRFPGGMARGFTCEAEAAWIARHASNQTPMQAFFVVKKNETFRRGR